MRRVWGRCWRQTTFPLTCGRKLLFPRARARVAVHSHALTRVAPPAGGRLPRGGVQVVVEVALAFVLVLVGAILSGGPLKRANAVTEGSDATCVLPSPPRGLPTSHTPCRCHRRSTLDAFFARPDFQVFNHRMRAFRSRYAQNGEGQS